MNDFSQLIIIFYILLLLLLVVKEVIPWLGFLITGFNHADTQNLECILLFQLASE